MEVSQKDTSIFLFLICKNLFSFLRIFTIAPTAFLFADSHHSTIYSPHITVAHFLLYFKENSIDNTLFQCAARALTNQGGHQNERYQTVNEYGRKI